MVDLVPGVGLTLTRSASHLRFGDSLGKVLAMIQDSLSLFGTVKMIVPEQAADASSQDVWLFLLQSGLKLKFDGATQELEHIEIFLVHREDAPFAKRVNWSLRGHNLVGAALTLEGIEQIMFQPTQPPRPQPSGLSLLTYDSGIRFVFQPSAGGKAGKKETSLAKVLLSRPTSAIRG